MLVSLVEHTAHQVNPRADAHLFARFHHLQCLVQQDFASKCVVYNFDNPVCQRKSSPRGVLLHAHTTSESQLDDNTSSKRI